MNSSLDEFANTSVVSVPEWVVELQEWREETFLKFIEPVIVTILGPVVENKYANQITDESRRRLSFLPSYVNDVNAFRETSMSFATLLMLYVIMCCVMLVFLSCFYHNQKTSPLFISPRRHRLPKLVPPPLPVDGLFSWMRVCFYLSDEEIINRVGYDSLIFIRFHRLALRCIVKMSMFSFVVILPLNFTGGGHANASDLKGYVGTLLFTDFLRFSMANVSGGSPRLWVHCVAAYLLSFIVMRELLVEYNHFNTIRHRYLLSKEPHLRTVLVTNIPRHLRAPSKISNYFRNVYPDAVKYVTMCQNLIKLEKLVNKRTNVLSNIERQLLILCRNEKRNLLANGRFFKLRKVPHHFFENMGIIDGAQERLTKLYNKLEDLNEQIAREQERRKKVMKRLDSLEAGKGRKDIDYILASPFLSDNPDPSAYVQRHQMSYLGTPRNPDGTVSRGHYIPPTISPANKPVNTNEYPNKDLANLSGAEAGDLAFKSEAEYKAAKIKKTKKGTIYNAKSAIKRYSRTIRSVSLFGRPNADDDPIGHTDDGSVDVLENHANEVTDKAIVVMKTFTASTIAIQSMHSSKPGSMQVTFAPEPRDILWDNVYISKGAKRTRSFIGDILIILLIAFYVVPVALVSLLVSESALVSFSPRLAQLDQASAFFSSAIALVQPICLVGIQQLLPPLFIQITKAEGIIAFSEVQMKAFSRYFMFQVLNVFLVTAIAGSIFDTLAIIIENPESAFEMLGNSLPKMSSFFITFVTMKAFLGLGVELVRIISLVQSSLRYLLFPNSTLRQQRAVRIGMRAIDDPGWFPFHKILAQDMLVVVISVVFAVVAPIVLLPCALFCLFSRMLWTHHHLYVNESVFETGGQFWPKIFRRFVFGLIIAQSTITGQFILKEARHEAYATIFLMFMTYVFLRSTRARFDGPSSTLPLEVATIMDISVSQEKEAQRRQQMQKANENNLQRIDEEQVQKEDNQSFPVPERTNTMDSSHESMGKVIGRFDPYEQSYLQPVLRANPRGRPEQPFPPSQLGREDVLFGTKTFSSLGLADEVTTDDGATVRLKSLNQHDRTLIDRWWNDQLQACGEFNFFSVLVGESCGMLRLGNRVNLFDNKRKMTYV